MSDIPPVLGSVVAGLTPSVDEGLTHTLQMGETLAGVAGGYGVSVSDLLAANPQVLHADLVSPGAQLSIPSAAARATGAVGETLAAAVPQTVGRVEGAVASLTGPLGAAVAPAFGGRGAAVVPGLVEGASSLVGGAVNAVRVAVGPPGLSGAAAPSAGAGTVPQIMAGVGSAATHVVDTAAVALPSATPGANGDSARWSQGASLQGSPLRGATSGAIDGLDAAVGTAASIAVGAGRAATGAASLLAVGIGDLGGGTARAAGSLADGLGRATAGTISALASEVGDPAGAASGVGALSAVGAVVDGATAPAFAAVDGRAVNDASEAIGSGAGLVGAVARGIGGAIGSTPAPAPAGDGPEAAPTPGPTEALPPAPGAGRPVAATLDPLQPQGADWGPMTQTAPPVPSALDPAETGAALDALPAPVAAQALAGLLEALAAVDPELAQTLVDELAQVGAAGGATGRDVALAAIAARLALPLATVGGQLGAAAAEPQEEAVALSLGPGGLTLALGGAEADAAVALRMPAEMVPGVDLPASAQRRRGTAKDKADGGRAGRRAKGGDPPPSPQRAWIERALGAAQSVKAGFGVPIAVTLAHGALASDWGRHAPGNDFFGLVGERAPAPANLVASALTVPAPAGPAFEDLDDAAAAFGGRLREAPRFARAFRAADPRSFVARLAEAGFARDPRYPAAMNAVIELNALQAYDG